MGMVRSGHACDGLQLPVECMLLLAACCTPVVSHEHCRRVDTDGATHQWLAVRT